MKDDYSTIPADWDSTSTLRFRSTVYHSKLRLVAGRDDVVFFSTMPRPNWFRCLMVRWLLGMEWLAT